MTSNRRCGRSLIGLLLPALLAGPAIPAAADPAEPTRIDGTRIALVVPDGFEVSEDFPGIGRPEDQASVIVAEMPAPYSVFVQGFTDEALASRGIRVGERETVEIDRREALMISGTQEGGGTTFHKLIALFGDEQATVLLNANVPAEHAAEHSGPLRAALLSVRWDRGGEGGPPVALGAGAAGSVPPPSPGGSPSAEHRLVLGCERDQLVVGTSVDCALTLEGYVPAGLGPAARPTSGSFFSGVRPGAGGRGFVYPFEVAGSEPGDLDLGPVTLSFEGRTLTSNPLRLRVLPEPAGEAPVALSASPARVAVGEPFDLVLVERDVPAVRIGPNVRSGRQPVAQPAGTGSPVSLAVNDLLEVQSQSSVSRMTPETGSRRITTYRVVARRPGRWVIGRDFLQGVGEGIEVSPAVVEVDES